MPPTATGQRASDRCRAQPAAAARPGAAADARPARPRRPRSPARHPVGDEGEHQQPPVARRARSRPATRPPVSVPVLARTTPAATRRSPRACTGRPACRSSRRPAGPSTTVQRAAARPRRDQPQHAGERGRADPVGGGEAAAVAASRRRRRRRAGPARLRTAAAAPVKRRRRVLGERDLPGQALGDDVVRLLQHLLDQLGDRRRLHARQRAARRPAPCPRSTGSVRAAEQRRPARAPAARSGVRAADRVAGLARPPSAITAVIGAA